MDLSETVRQMRRQLGMTQDALAEASGLVDRTRVAAIETGRLKASSPAARRALSQGFGLSLDDLDALLDGRLAVDDAVARSSRPAAPKDAPAPKVV